MSLRLIGSAILLAMLCTPRCLVALSAIDGGRDISVALFSTRTVRSVTVTPLDTQAWIANCSRCAQKPLREPLQVFGNMEIFAGGTIRVTELNDGDSRTATGLWHLRSNGTQQDIDVVLTIPSERYVSAVLNAEASPDEPGQSLRALAIVARTYALNGPHYRAAPGHLRAQLCDSTQCEAMLLKRPTPAIEEAVRSTAGETLWFGAGRAQVFYSQNCGGVTEDAGTVWPKLHGAPYLETHPDPYCLRRDRAAWHAQIPIAKFIEIARLQAWHTPREINIVRVAVRSRSNRAQRIEFEGHDGRTAIVSATALRFAINRALGWNTVRSDAYELGMRNGSLVFDGHGYGHGVGLCQVGAAQIAHDGEIERAILAFYFPGTSVRILPADDGWHETQMSPLTLFSTTLLTDARKVEIRRMWADAQTSFVSDRSLSPKIFFAPTGEIYRQLTTQPGWTLGSTRGDVIVLQPGSVFKSLGRESNATLRHEMLHALVEAESSTKAPLWLREGLAEDLAGEQTRNAETMSLTQIESELSHPGSQFKSERAHRAAAQRVRELLARYGLSEVRGWLSSGVPAGES